MLALFTSLCRAAGVIGDIHAIRRHDLEAGQRHLEGFPGVGFPLWLGDPVGAGAMTLR